MQTKHVPVLPDEVLKFLQPRAGGRYIDGTLGGGGHAGMVLDRIAPGGRVLGIDTDSEALARVRERFPDATDAGRLVLAHGNFADLARIAHESDFVPVDGVLLDLGFSSDQMDNPARGLSFNADGPLDMRLDRERDESAADIVNEASEQELATIFWRYGEESRSRQIARRIVRERAKGAITSTARLAQIAAAGVPYRYGAIHPATKVFQALRIAVNHELEQLETVLPQILDVLRAEDMEDMNDRANEGDDVGAGGCMVIISFHSLEDRIVKEFMRREATDCLCPPELPVCVCGHKARLRLLTRKPITAEAGEVSTNPRARSARLRAAVKIA